VRKAPVIDEPMYLYAGALAWTQGAFETNREHPPLLKQLYALPLVLAGFELPDDAATRMDAPTRHLFEWNRERAGLGLVLGRSVAILVAAVGAFLVWRESRALHGPAGGLFSLALYAATPLVVGHAALAVLDLGCGVAALAATMALRRFVDAPSAGRLLLAGTLLGAALATKFTALLVLPLGIALLLLGAVARRDFRAPLPGPLGGGSVVARIAGGGTCAILLVVLGAGFLYVDYGLQQEPLETEPWTVAAAAEASDGGTWRTRVEIPFASFWRGLAYQREHGEAGHPNFLLGEVSSQGWPHFYLVAALARLPIPVLLAVLAGLALTFRRRGKELLDDAFLLAFPAATLYALSFHSKAQGLRYLLPVLPFLLVFAGRVGSEAWRLGIPARAILAMLLAWLAWGTLRVHPHHLLYANEIAGGPDGGVHWTVVGDDWGQDLSELGRWLRERGRQGETVRFRPYLQAAIHRAAIPSYYGVLFDEREESICRPAQGLHAVHAVDLLRPTLPNPSCYGWLARREPVARLGHAILVYDVPESDLDAREREVDVIAR
jgi:hypothetical protein